MSKRKFITVALASGLLTSACQSTASIVGSKEDQLAAAGFTLQPANTPARLAALKSLTLTTTFSGGMNGDNWNMNSLTVTAVGNGLSKQIGSYGFKRFTGDQKQLSVPLTP